MTRLIQSMEIGDKAFGWTVLAAFLVFLAHRPVLQAVDDLTTPQPWFEVSFTIPDHKIGEVPDVQYRRSIQRALRGHWSVRIFSPPAARPYLCAGSGYAYYQPEISGTITMSLHDFIGSRCRPNAGTYTACSLYELTDKRDVTREFGPFCTGFTVSN